jgi:hypothetical protein
MLQEARRADHCCVAVPAAAKSLPLAEGDTALGQIVGREFDPDFVAGDNANKVFAHPARDVGGHNMSALDFHAESSICECLSYDPFNFKGFFFLLRHTFFLGQLPWFADDILLLLR